MYDYIMAEEILVLSSYPPKEDPTDSTIKVGGLAFFIQNILKEIPGLQFKVLAEVLEGPSNYMDETNIHVLRCWRRSSTIDLFKVIKLIYSSSAKKIIINYDFGVFGNIWTVLFFPLVLILIKLKIRNIIFIQHSTLYKLEKIHGHLQKSAKDIRLKIYNLGIIHYLMFFSWISKKVIVLEPECKKRLAKLPIINEEKILVIPHPIYPPGKGIQISKKTDSDSDETNKFVLLFFGFLTWYKGADWLIECTLTPAWPADVHLIMAGGKTINVENDKYYSGLIDLIAESPHITHTGYVPEEEKDMYFRQADLVVLPYRALMASSGPLATAIGYQKPFVLSEHLKAYTDAPDFKRSMKELNIRDDELFFDMNDCGKMIHKIEDVRHTPELLDKLTRLSQRLHQLRSVKKIAARYEKIFKN